MLIVYILSCFSSSLLLVLLPEWWMWGARGLRGESGSTALRTWPPSCSWWLSVSMTRSWLSLTMRWVTDEVVLYVVAFSHYILLEQVFSLTIWEQKHVFILYMCKVFFWDKITYIDLNMIVWSKYLVWTYIQILVKLNISSCPVLE